MDKLMLYTIKSDYVNYLKNFDPNVKNNDRNAKIRPYAGILFCFNDVNYFAPLCSPKPKHTTMADNIDFIRVEYQGRLLCIINLSSMIPVLNSEVELINFNAVEKQYKALLEKEYIGIRKKKTLIVKNANMLYEKITKHRDENEKLARRCCNYLVLEQKMNDYNK